MSECTVREVQYSVITETTTYAVFIGLFATLGGTASTLAIHIWKEARRVAEKPVIEPDDEFNARLRALFVTWLRQALVRADGVRESTVFSELKQVIREADVTREQLDILLKEFEQRERSAALRQERDTMFEKSYKHFAWLAADSFGFAIVLGIFYTAGLGLSFWPPDKWDIVLVLISVHMATSLYQGVLKFKIANSAHKNLKKLAAESDDEREALFDGGEVADLFTSAVDDKDALDKSVEQTPDSASGSKEADEDSERDQK